MQIYCKQNPINFRVRNLFYTRHFFSYIFLEIDFPFIEKKSSWLLFGYFVMLLIFIFEPEHQREFETYRPLIFSWPFSHPSWRRVITIINVNVIINFSCRYSISHSYETLSQQRRSNQRAQRVQSFGMRVSSLFLRVRSVVVGRVPAFRREAGSSCAAERQTH